MTVSYCDKNEIFIGKFVHTAQFIFNTHFVLTLILICGIIPVSAAF